LGSGQDGGDNNQGSINASRGDGSDPEGVDQNSNRSWQKAGANNNNASNADRSKRSFRETNSDPNNGNPNDSKRQGSGFGDSKSQFAEDSGEMRSAQSDDRNNNYGNEDMDDDNEGDGDNGRSRGKLSGKDGEGGVDSSDRTKGKTMNFGRQGSDSDASSKNKGINMHTYIHMNICTHIYAYFQNSPYFLEFVRHGTPH
jgi:hypothetical protein